MPPTSMSLCLLKKKKKKKSVEPSIQFVFCELEMPFQAILLDFFFLCNHELGKGREGKGTTGKVFCFTHIDSLCIRGHTSSQQNVYLFCLRETQVFFYLE